MGSSGINASTHFSFFLVPFFLRGEIFFSPPPPRLFYFQTYSPTGTNCIFFYFIFHHFPPSFHIFFVHLRRDIIGLPERALSRAWRLFGGRAKVDISVSIIF